MTQQATQTQTESAQAAAAVATEPTLDELAAKLFKPEPTIVVPGADAAEKTDAAKEGEGTTEQTPPDPKAEKVSGRIAAALRAEHRAERERTELRAERERLNAEKAALDAREKKIRLVEEDPVKFFEEFKADPKAFLEKLSGEYKPENVATKELSALKDEVKQLRDDRAQRDAAQRDAEARAQADASWRDASAAFVAHVSEQAERYPSLTQEFTDAEATELAFKVLSEPVGRTQDGKPITRTQAYHAQFGVWPDHDVIAEHLDKIAQQRIEARAKSPWRKPGASAASGSQPSLGDPNPATPVKVASPRTLTSREASQRAAAPKPWTQEQADADSLAILQAALSKA